ncbi:MAG: fimbrial protein [Bacteroides sp.]|nr:fimbrial protein [Bacteroides sp.]
MKIHYVIYVLVAFLLASCSSTSEEEGQTPVYGKIDVAISVTVPKPETVATRAGSYTDTDIKNVDVLVFDENDKFMKRVKVEASELAATAIGVTFKVGLDATAKKRTVHLVTNGRTADGVTDRLNFDDLNTSMTETAAISALQTESLEHVSGGESTLMDNVMPLVMWDVLS